MQRGPWLGPRVPRPSRSRARLVVLASLGRCGSPSSMCRSTCCMQGRCWCLTPSCRCLSCSKVSQNVSFIARVVTTYASDDAQESRFETSDTPIVSGRCSHQEISIGGRVTRGGRQSSISTISSGSPSLLWLSDEI